MISGKLKKRHYNEVHLINTSVPGQKTDLVCLGSVRVRFTVTQPKIVVFSHGDKAIQCLSLKSHADATWNITNAIQLNTSNCCNALETQTNFY